MTDPKDKKKSENFNLDPHQTGIHEMPGVTKLLNLKSLKKEAEEKATSTSILTETGIELNFSPQSRPEPIIKPKIQKTVRTKSPIQSAPLLEWKNFDLEKSTDLLSKIILELLKTQLKHVLYLKREQNIFKATASFLPIERISLWQGLEWNPSLTPEAWTELHQKGFAEFSPPGTKTSMTSTRNLIRTAFGAKPTEWITLVHVGEPKNPSGVAAFFSSESLNPKLASLLSPNQKKITQR